MMVLQPVVASRIFLASPAAADVVCSSTIPGTIIKIEAKVTETAVESTYYFNVAFPVGSSGNEFDAKLGSGLNNGDAYPVELTTPTTGATVVIDNHGSATKENIQVASGTVAGTHSGGTVVADFMMAVGNDS